MTVVILAAYPLSKENSRLKGRTFFVWFFMVSILFTGGLIPLYMTVSQLGLIDNIFALVFPYSVQVFNIVLLLNFFRNVPKEIEEAAVIDGAGQWRILWQIYVPISKTALATLVLFVTVFNWNSWFDGMIFMNHIDNYPLQTYLRTVVINNDLSSILSKSVEEAKKMMELSQRTIITAQIFIGALPVLAVYPFLQKYFVKGMTIGSVKG
jgi:putative aldouronate transport system permease protein